MKSCTLLMIVNEPHLLMEMKLYLITYLCQRNASLLLPCKGNPLRNLLSNFPSHLLVEVNDLHDDRVTYSFAQDLVPKPVS